MPVKALAVKALLAWALSVMMAGMILWLGAGAAPAQVAYYVLDGSGGVSAGADLRLTGVLGKPVAGPAPGSALLLTSGYRLGCEPAYRTFLPVVRP